LGKKNKVNQKQISKDLLVFTICSLLIITFFIPIGIVSALGQQVDSWTAEPMYISPFAGSSSPIGYSPSQIRTAYNLPASGGAGTTIAIIDAYDTPNILNYFNTFSNQYGLPNNSTGCFIVHKMEQNMQTDSNWALETCLDVQWAHAIAPEAKILLVEAVGPTDTALLAAIDYATNQPGVVSVSMSWGGDEFLGETKEINHFNKPGTTFFASSGDDGSNVMWPAVLANVVSVGGTTLNLRADGTVISETAWGNSSGGLSAYVEIPKYQTNFGLNYSKRAVPDVSFNGNPSTGVSVFNGSWWKIGGTSAGAPQWAAINAVGRSVTNENLYDRAKSSYSSYFRDITLGLNYVNSAAEGYDLVTGLGSPLGVNFGKVTVSPTSGPPSGLITINVLGFTIGTSVNISYKTIMNTLWVPLISNLQIASDNFSYTFNAPDLLQNNAPGDNQPQFEYITFRVIDNNSQVYYTTNQYREWRRGLIQVGNNTATGLFGNNTNLATNVFVQNGDLLLVIGEWFSPGNLSLFWDNIISLGSIPIDGKGFFNGTAQVPTTTAGQHTLTMNDGITNFCVNITRLPTVTNNYTNQWRNSDFEIDLSPDYNVNETFYRLNGGSTRNLIANGQPTITTESNNNTVEYWSTWNVYGTVLNELPHKTVTEIKLDKTAPIGTITTEITTAQTPTIMLTLEATDETSGVAQMRFSNDNFTWSNWEPYQTSKTWTLLDEDGIKTISVQFIDNAGLTSTYSHTLKLETSLSTTTLTSTPYPDFTFLTTMPLSTIPSQNPIKTSEPIPTATASPTSISLPSLVNDSPIPSTTPDSTSVTSPNNTPTSPPALPEIPHWTLIILILSSLGSVLLFRKLSKKQ
jgi:hypothetical protein